MCSSTGVIAASDTRSPGDLSSRPATPLEHVRKLPAFRPSAESKVDPMYSLFSQ